MENWRDIPNSGGLYEASSLGRIRSKDRVVMRLNRWGHIAPVRMSGRVIKPWRDANGYGTVYICFDGQRLVRSVHRLVCAAFHGESDKQVNHKDGNKTNNLPENLEWCTKAENMEHARETGLLCDRMAVVGTAPDGTVVQFKSINAAARATGAHRSCLQKAVRGELRTAGGLFWRLAS